MTLVDIGRRRSSRCTRAGVKTVGDSYELDAIVFATGFDAMTGALFAIDIRGADGVALRGRVGGRAAGVPGAGRRRVPEHVHHHRAGVAVGAQQHGAVDRAARGVDPGLRRLPVRARVRDGGGDCRDAEDAWMEHVTEVAYSTLFPKADSWYIGANIPGKPRVFTTYVGGCRAVPGPSATRWPRRATRGLRSAPLDVVFNLILPDFNGDGQLSEVE